ncbi:MAG TPA: rhomboid family intramembrane serine protease [Saprospiraceae bacterium]|nr:rhomboid family intramembrane serine protease [Saprospiraceae bacterium]
MNKGVEHTKNSLLLSLSFAAMVGLLCFVVFLFGLLFPYSKFEWAIYPRDLSQWYGIFTAPFIHNSWAHLFSNLPPLMATITMIFFFYRSIGWGVFVMVWLLTGIAVFTFARPASHIGASGLVYGLIGFVFFSGVFRRNIKSIVLMTIVVVMYGGGYLAGVLPIEKGVSWESHLFGALIGAWTAFVFRNFREPDEETQKPSWAGEDNSKKDYYFQRDVFEKTIEQRRREEEELRNQSSEDPLR